MPKAFVIVNEGCRIDSNEIRRFCRDRLADYMIPKVVQVVGEEELVGEAVDEAFPLPSPASGRGAGGAYKCRFFHVSPSSTGNDKLSGEMGRAGQGSGQPWPSGNG